MGNVVDYKGYGKDTVSLSLVIGAAVLVFTVACLYVFYLYSSNRMIRVRGKGNSLSLGVLLSCTCAIATAICVDDPFTSCPCAVLLIVAPLLPLCHKFEVYLLRFHRLYQFNAQTSAITSQSSDPGASFRYRSKRTHHRELRILTAVNTFFAAGMATATAVYVISYTGLDIPSTYNECIDTSGHLQIVLGAFAMNGVVMIFLMLPILRELSRHARYAADSLGLRRVLVRMCANSFAGMMLLVLGGIGMFWDLPVRWPIGTLALSLFVIFVDIIIVPCKQAMRDMREQKILEAAMLSGDELGLDRNVSLLKAFLHSKDGHASVASHLRKELGMETLEFIIDAVRYKRRYGKSSSKTKSRKHNLKSARSSRENKDKDTSKDTDQMRTECMRIFRKFIWSKAANQINLPDSYMRPFAPLEAKKYNALNKSTRHFGRISGPAAVAPAPPPMPEDFSVTPNIFDECVREVLNMLFYDSFQRYLQDPEQNALWAKFQREMAHVRSLSGFQRRSSSVSDSLDISSSTPSHQQIAPI